MVNMKVLAYKEWISTELERCIDFWLKNGMDTENGGICTSLLKNGERYSNEKGVWMQGRSAWMFSYLCNVYGKQDEWITAAKSCIDFMEAYCFADKDNFRLYLAIDNDGNPISQNRSCFSESFYCIGNAEYSLASGDISALRRARKAYNIIWKLNNELIKDINGSGSKTLLGDIPARALADSMIYLNITSVMRRCDMENKELYDERSRQCIDNIFKYHHKPELKCTLETVAKDGTVIDILSKGRVINPGHDIECSWFLMEEANYFSDDNVHKLAEEMFNMAYENGIDRTHGGLISFADLKGLPSEMRFADKKTWWPQCELLIASLMLYRDTGDEKYADCFIKEIEYCKRVFSDEKYGEWYEQLNIDGTQNDHSFKGGIFKGPFHLPRMLVMVDRMLDEIENKAKL